MQIIANKYHKTMQITMRSQPNYIVLRFFVVVVVAVDIVAVVPVFVVVVSLSDHINFSCVNLLLLTLLL